MEITETTRLGGDEPFTSLSDIAARENNDLRKSGKEVLIDLYS